MTFEEFSAALGGYSYLELSKLDENELARRRIYNHLLASGADPLAVLRGEGKVSEAGPALKALRDFATELGDRYLHTKNEELALVWLTTNSRLCELVYALERSALSAAPPALTDLRELAEKWRTATYVEWNDIDDCAEDAAFETLRGCASELTAALDAMGAKK